jgi:hypothetical protein
MAKFHDLLGVLREPGEEGLPPTIYDDLTGEYDAMESGGAAKAAELADALAARDAEIGALKAQNYDLLMAVGSTDDTDDNDSTDDEPDESGSAVDGLFG